MQTSVLDFAGSPRSDRALLRAHFLQEKSDGSYSKYTCSWAPCETSSASGAAATRYLQTCFSDPVAVGRQFTAAKVRCHRLAAKVPVAPFIARRFLRESPVICHVNRRTGRHRIAESFDSYLAATLCRVLPSNNHMRLQLQVFSLRRFAALEVPLSSPSLTGHLDCLICDDERDILYALEVKSYPSDPTDCWAGTPRSTLYRNLVQSLAYCELLSHNTRSTRVATGLLHRDGILVADATKWLRGERTLLRAVETYLSTRGERLARPRTSRTYP